MKTLENQKGYALIMVMLLILIFTTLGMGLLAMNMNAAKQFNTKEDQVQARHYAEMGLLHYQALIGNVVNQYKFKATQAGAVTAISKSRQEICNQIRAIGTIQQSQIGGTYKIPTVELNNCGSSDTGKITITIKSTGSAETGISKLVEGKVEVTPPEILSNSFDPVKGPAIPTKPVNNTGKETITKYPSTGDVRGFVEMDGPFTINRAAYNFESFIINSPSSVNALINTGGNNNDSLKVEKDLYIGGGVYSNNHICIYVQGNLTILGNIDLGPHSLILVYGDAYFKGSINYNSSTKVHVIGNTYVGASKTLTNTYKNFQGYTSKCEKDIKWPDPVEVANIGKEYSWSKNNQLNVIYH